MVLSVDDIVSKFPIKTLPIITSEPNYESINKMVQTLYGNAASLSTTLGGGQHGHIGLIMTPTLYATLTETPYNEPNDPGVLPFIPPGSTAAARELINLQYKEERRIYDQHTNMDDALKSQIIDSIQETYINALRNKYTGYLGVTTRDLIDHLLDRYGKITPADIEDCKQRLQAPLDSTQPIDIYFQRIDDSVQYAADGKVAFTNEQILQTAYHAISTSGYYTEACKEWRKKPAATKTWVLFKNFFTEEYHDLKEQNKVNNNQANFHSANSVVNISTALDNLAMAATNDRDIVAQLTQTNQQLTATNKLLTEQLKTAMETNNNLTKKLGQSTSPTPPTNNRRPPRTPFDHAAWLADLNPTGYCWTHGYRVVHGHDSGHCGGKAAGHIATATRTNPQGGSIKGKPTP